MNDTWKSTREHFNRVAQETQTTTYEDRRWRQNARTIQQFEHTESFIRKNVIPNVANAQTITELGPGPGTWTKLICANTQKTTSFMLTDISSEMLERAKTVIPTSNQVSTFEGPFLDVAIPPESTDVFFSSRALEYVGDPARATAKIYTLLRQNGFGCIITKTPKKHIHALRGYVPSTLHQGQIEPKELIALLKSAGFTKIQLYPVTFSFPFLKSAYADNVISKLLSTYHTDFLLKVFTESYAVTFWKQNTHAEQNK